MRDVEFLRIETSRDAYGPDDVANKTMTIGELIEILSMYDEDKPIILSFDNGYTFGGLTERQIDTDSFVED